jgi:type VI secretion system secreted protein Hcp
MAFDAFLKLDGIPGESQDKNHPNEIEIESYSWGLSNSGSLGSGGGGGAGKASFQDMSFTSLASAAGPLLAAACATGRHIANAVLTLRKSGGGGGGLEFIKIKLEDVLVSSYSQGGAADGQASRPSEDFSLNFAKITFDYYPQAAGGQAGTPVEFNFDLRENRT